MSSRPWRRNRRGRVQRELLADFAVDSRRVRCRVGDVRRGHQGERHERDRGRSRHHRNNQHTKGEGVFHGLRSASHSGQVALDLLFDFAVTNPRELQAHPLIGQRPIVGLDNIVAFLVDREDVDG